MRKMSMVGCRYMNKEIKDFKTEELKAIAYDQIAIIDRAKVNLTALNEELARRAQEEQTATEAPIQEDKKTSKK